VLLCRIRIGTAFVLAGGLKKMRRGVPRPGCVNVLTALLTTACISVAMAQSSRDASFAQDILAPAAPVADRPAGKTAQAPKKNAVPQAGVKVAQRPSGAGVPAIADNVQLTLLIQNSMAAVSQANMTGNYSVLHALAAPSFQQVNPPEKLGQIFAALRTNNIDLTPVILYQPVVSYISSIDDKGMFRMTGHYNTQPQNVLFDMLFVSFQGHWRLHGIAIQTRAAQQVSPQPVPASAAKTPAPAKLK